MNPRFRPFYYAIGALVAVWVLAMAGYAIAEHYKVTAEKIRAYLDTTDLNGLTGDARARALRKLAAMINALSPDERRQARLGHLWSHWFSEMTEEEKGAFLEATMPSGFKQMLGSFENLPPEKRQKTIDFAIKQLRDARDQSPEEYKKSSQSKGTNNPVLSEDLQRKVAMIGLKSVYTDSSAETKAELAPLLEEMQKNMEAGRLFRERN